MLIQIGLHIRMQAIRIAILGAAQEAQVRDGRSVEKVLQIAQHHARSIDVARLEFPHRLDHCQRDLVLICCCPHTDWAISILHMYIYMCDLLLCVCVCLDWVSNESWWCCLGSTVNSQATTITDIRKDSLKDSQRNQHQFCCCCVQPKPSAEWVGLGGFDREITDEINQHEVFKGKMQLELHGVV